MVSSINHNLLVVNTARNLNSHYSALAASTRRLSSGLRVNSSADDTAGLAIRELQRADIASLQQGARNANDAISMIQVADGALAVIDEKLIRMKELAEQAATGTYDSTQRLMIDSEFQAMASEIDRIATATDFNGIHLLDGSLSGAHDGSGLVAKGKMKIHFGTGNDSAEDYYYVEIGVCTTKGLGLRDAAAQNGKPADSQPEAPVVKPNTITYNDLANSAFQTVNMPANGIEKMTDALPNGQWIIGSAPVGSSFAGYNNFMIVIPAGTKNIIINTNGHSTQAGTGASGHNDAQLFTADGKHLAGTPLDDYSWNYGVGVDNVSASLEDSKDRLPFDPADYDGSQLNSGPPVYPGDLTTLHFSNYNGMKIGYSGDGDRHDAVPNDGNSQTWPDYQLLTINEAKEDLILMLPGAASGFIKAYWDVPDDDFALVTGKIEPNPDKPELASAGELLSIQTQDNAQKALGRINEAIVRKDQILAKLGAMQNRLENTVSNISIQAENLQAAESRISDVDVATEMTAFVRNQILTQSATAMLGQANSLPQMLTQLIGQ